MLGIRQRYAKLHIGVWGRRSSLVW
jgi:hypothetical protein